MEINVAKSAGFCFGVKRAIDIALKTAQAGKNVYMLGDIVHNEEVVSAIEEAGIHKINHLTNGNNKTLLIRAHGTSLATLKKAAKLGFQIFDATCPMVKEIHQIAQRMENSGCTVIIIGDKRHDEVRGIAGHLRKKAIIIDRYETIPLSRIRKIKKACVVVQSTQNLDEVLTIVALLKKYIPEVRFFNTICRPTRQKQEEIKTMPLKNDVMIVIGSKHSANTKRLYQIAKSLNARSYWVSAKKDINVRWFAKARSVGITAGASTPDNTTQEIIRYLKTLKKH
ncbi:MAG: 4-hydroxy-3-methylbut-2-enyl diphosphate reductase [Candidatus Omnitrophica bacterium]|nr:4-hydroxy-3-methylbut-2-enyl diphosphate reductase [Candidatus Omnitrophota bacterium]